MIRPYDQLMKASLQHPLLKGILVQATPAFEPPLLILIHPVQSVFVFDGLV